MFTLIQTKTLINYERKFFFCFFHMEKIQNPFVLKSDNDSGAVIDL